MTRIVIAEPLDFNPEALEIVSSVGEVSLRPVDREGLLDAVRDCDALIVRLRFRIDEEVFAAGPQLAVVASPTTGLDHIDLEAATARGITVLSLRGERAFMDRIPATAEHTWALLLALVRRIPWAAASVVEGNWNRDDFRGRELFGKRLGIVGLGRVGRQVSQFGRAFAMTVAAYDPGVTDWPSDVERRSSLEALLETSDVVTLHVPLDASTLGMIGDAELDAMRPTALLVNTSRGEIVDEPALIGALERGSIAGAALDVVADERSASRDTPVIAYASAHDDLLVTPHIAGATHESMARTEVFIANRLVEFFRGRA